MLFRSEDLPATPLEIALAWMDQTEQGSTGLPLITGPGAWSALAASPLLLNRYVATPDGRLVPETDFARFRYERDAQADAAIAGYRRAKGADMAKFLALPLAATREAQAARQARLDTQAASSGEEKLLARLDRAGMCRRGHAAPPAHAVTGCGAPWLHARRPHGPLSAPRARESDRRSDVDDPQIGRAHV